MVDPMVLESRHQGGPQQPRREPVAIMEPVNVGLVPARHVGLAVGYFSHGGAEPWPKTRLTLGR